MKLGALTMTKNYADAYKNAANTDKGFTSTIQLLCALAMGENNLSNESATTPDVLSKTITELQSGSLMRPLVVKRQTARP